MKTITHHTKTYFFVIMLILFFGGVLFEIKAQGNVSFQVFYEELQPYGSWLQHPDYGDVWSPNVDSGFVPYATNGNWTVTQYGNTWVSNYDWGWAPFHYGRWYNDNFYGWVWVPGNEWAPAWVTWRNGGGYYGWAPMLPGLNFSLSVSVFSRIPNHYWTFVPYQYVWHESVYNYCAPRYGNAYIIHNTTYVTHYYNHHHDHHRYFTGPSHDEIRHATNRPVKEYHIEDGHRPGRSNSDRGRISMYRPTVSNDGNDRPWRSGQSSNDYGQGRGNNEGREGSHYGAANDSGQLNDSRGRVKGLDIGNQNQTGSAGRSIDQSNNGSFNDLESGNRSRSFESSNQINMGSTINERGNGSRGQNDSRNSIGWGSGNSTRNSRQQTIPGQVWGGSGTKINRSQTTSGGYSHNGNGRSNSLNQVSNRSTGGARMTVPTRSNGSNGGSPQVAPNRFSGSNLVQMKR